MTQFDTALLIGADFQTGQEAAEPAPTAVTMVRQPPAACPGAARRRALASRAGSVLNEICRRRWQLNC